LVIGFIDGDGCIQLRKNYKINKNRLLIGIHQNWIRNLILFYEFIHNYLNFYINKKLGGYPSLKDNNKISYINGRKIISNYKLKSFCYIDDINLITKMKKEALRLHLPVMERKWNKVKLNDYK